MNVPNEPQDLVNYGYSPGYLLYRDGRLWSSLTRGRGSAGFKTLDRTGCTIIRDKNGKYVRRSPKILAFNVYIVPQLINSGYVPIYNATAYINKCGDVYSSSTGEKLVWNLSHKYYYVHVGGKDRLVHRVVAETFIPNPDNLPEVDHIDGDKSNNCVENLRWVTRSQNMKYAFESGVLNESLSKSLVARWKHRRNQVDVLI